MFGQSRGGLWHRLQHCHQASDPLVFFLLPAVLALTALVAVWIPAVRATRINPIDALRYE